MHGGPKAILALKREEDMMPDFSGPGYISAKKKMVHGCGHPDHDQKDDAYASEPMTTDDTYEGPDEGDTDPPMDDMDIDAKLKQMKQMASEIMQISNELEKASKMHQGQADKLKDMAEDHDEAIGGDSLKEEEVSRPGEEAVQLSKQDMRYVKKKRRKKAREERQKERRRNVVYLDEEE